MTKNSSFSNDVTMVARDGMKTEQSVASHSSFSGSAFDRDVTMRVPLAMQKSGFAIGDIIMNRYVVEAELGRGGMGVVYKCLYRQGKTHVALKTLPPELSHSKSEMENVRDNFALVQNLNHPNIANVKFLEEDGRTGDYYLIMECVEGEGLKSWVRKKRRVGAVTLEDIMPVIEKIADALDYAHGQGVIHRDIKPGNVMIDEKGNVKILDFGLAAQIHTSMTYVSMAYQNISGTGPYMAPEQWQGRKQGAASDQYALAVLTYELLSGNLPFESPDTNILKKAVLEDAPEAIDGVSHTVQQALNRALAKDPRQRFACCRDFVAALKLGKKSLKGVWVALALSALAVCGSVSFYHRQQKEQIGLAEMKHREAERVKAGKEANRQRADAVAKVEQKRRKAERVKAEKGVNRQRADAAAKVEQKRVVRKVAKRNEVEVSDQAEKKHREEMRRKEERQKKENENLIALTASNYRHQAALERAKKDIDFQKLDRGQKFEEKIRTFEENLDAGKKALEKDNYTHQKIANDSFLEAKEAIEWIRENISLREMAQRERENVMAKKKLAEVEEGKIHAYEVHREAEDLLMRGETLFESAEFAAAASSFEEAAKKYVQTQMKARVVRISLILESAKIAESQSNWQKVLESANEVLTMDADNQQAKDYKRKAEASLEPSFDLYGTIDGKTVESSYVSHEAKPQGDKWPKILEKGKTYSFTLTHEASDGTKYVGKTSFTCDWLGVKDIVVPLKKELFTGKVDLSGGVKLEMVFVEKGNFTMSPNDGENFGDEVSHPVTINNSFYIGKYEVTQEEWKSVMSQRRCTQDNEVHSKPSHWDGARLPVESVSWHDAMDFCDELNKKGKAPRGWKFTLPTETQWEYAARGGKHKSGYKYSGSDNVSEVAWCFENANSKTHPVGLKKGNALGIFDMSGNVYEWCLDNYERDSSKSVPEFERGIDSDRLSRVLRGGSWGNSAWYCRSADRNNRSPMDRRYFLGFRVALVPVQ